MTRYRITIEYDGAGFVGWQRQANGLSSAQGAIEHAIHAFSGESPTVHGAGRTDAGVHALGQVAHFDLAKPATPAVIRDALNYHLRPQSISVIGVAPADPSFDARRSARGRAYLYRILNRRAPAALDRGKVWHIGRPLDATRMHAAAQHLVGKHDFSAFRAAECQAKSPVRTLDLVTVALAGEEVHIHAHARSFLHNQVRIIAGTLRLVGEGKWTAVDVAAALASRDRRAAGPTAPPHGLTLTAIFY